MTQTERIKYYEDVLDKAVSAEAELMPALEKYKKLIPKIRELEAYYVGDEWKSDFESDEKGLLPKDLKRGVLSEDAVFDLLENRREILANMLETVLSAMRG